MAAVVDQVLEGVGGHGGDATDRALGDERAREAIARGPAPVQTEGERHLGLLADTHNALDLSQADGEWFVAQDALHARRHRLLYLAYVHRLAGGDAHQVRPDL